MKFTLSCLIALPAETLKKMSTQELELAQADLMKECYTVGKVKPQTENQKKYLAALREATHKVDHELFIRRQA